jgi:hypothetical protein
MGRHCCSDGKRALAKWCLNQMARASFGECCWKPMSGVDNQTKFVVPDGSPVRTHAPYGSAALTDDRPGQAELMRCCPDRVPAPRSGFARWFR